MRDLWRRRNFAGYRYAATWLLLGVCLVWLVGSAGATLYTVADCSCGAIGLPLDGGYPADWPESGGYTLTCQYGGYGTIPYVGKGNSVEFVLNKEKPDVALLEFQGRAGALPRIAPTTPTTLEFDRSDPNRAVYSSKKQEGSKVTYTGTHVLVYKNTNYIFVYGFGYDVGDSRFISVLNAAESCARAAADAKTPGTLTTTPATTKPTTTVKTTTKPTPAKQITNKSVTTRQTTTIPTTTPTTEHPTEEPATPTPTPTTLAIIEPEITDTFTRTPTPAPPPTPAPTLVQDRTPVKFRPEDCEGLAVSPARWDVTYNKKELRRNLVHVLDVYAQKKGLKSASDKFTGLDPTGWARLQGFMFVSNLQYVEGSRFFSGHEAELAERIKARATSQGHKLQPGEVLEESLNLNDGYVFDSLLTVHNVLKEETYDVRNAQANARKLTMEATADLNDVETRLRSEGVLGDGGEISRPQQGFTSYQQELINKRTFEQGIIADQKKVLADFRLFNNLELIRTREDNMGSWYHLFGTMSMGYGQNVLNWYHFGDPATRDVFLEHRVYKGGFENIVNLVTGEKVRDIDLVEYCYDLWGPGIGGDMFRRVQENQDRVTEVLTTNPQVWKTESWEPRRITDGYAGRTLAE